MLFAVASIQDLVSGLAFSLQLFIEFSINFNVEVVMETNLFTVFNAVKSECASLWGLAPGRKSKGYLRAIDSGQELTHPLQFQPVELILNGLFS